MAITDFEAWFDETIDDFEDAYCLYMAVTEKLVMEFMMWK